MWCSVGCIVLLLIGPYDGALLSASRLQANTTDAGSISTRGPLVLLQMIIPTFKEPRIEKGMEVKENHVNKHSLCCVAAFKDNPAPDSFLKLSRV